MLKGAHLVHPLSKPLELAVSKFADIPVEMPPSILAEKNPATLHHSRKLCEFFYSHVLGEKRPAMQMIVENHCHLARSGAFQFATSNSITF